MSKIGNLRVPHDFASCPPHSRMVNDRFAICCARRRELLQPCDIFTTTVCAWVCMLAAIEKKNNATNHTNFGPRKEIRKELFGGQLVFISAYSASEAWKTHLRLVCAAARCRRASARHWRD